MIFNSLVSHVNLTYNNYNVYCLKLFSRVGAKLINKLHKSTFPQKELELRYSYTILSVSWISLWSGNILTIKIYFSAPLTFAAMNFIWPKIGTFNGYFFRISPKFSPALTNRSQSRKANRVSARLSAVLIFYLLHLDCVYFLEVLLLLGPPAQVIWSGEHDGDQSEASIQATWPISTNQRPVSGESDGAARIVMTNQPETLVRWEIMRIHKEQAMLLVSCSLLRLVS